MRNAGQGGVHSLRITVFKMWAWRPHGREPTHRPATIEKEQKKTNVIFFWALRAAIPYSNKAL